MLPDVQRWSDITWILWDEIAGSREEAYNLKYSMSRFEGPLLDSAVISAPMEKSQNPHGIRKNWTGGCAAVSPILHDLLLGVERPLDSYIYLQIPNHSMMRID